MNLPQVWTLKYSLRSGGKWKTALCSDVCPGGQKVPFLFESKEAASEFGESLKKNSNDKINHILAETLKVNFDRMKPAPEGQQQAGGAPQEYNKEENIQSLKKWLVDFKDLAPMSAKGYWVMFEALKKNGFSPEEAIQLIVPAMRFIAGR